MAELSKRLEAVAGMVTAGMRLADIGTDHGYLPIHLVKRGMIPSAIAMDVNKGPLMRAQEHIRAEGLEDKIITRLSDGLKNLKKNEADIMIAAGMGGVLVIRILSEGDGEIKGIKEYILQPQSEIKKVRAYLSESGYCIVQENMVLEDGKYYPMMKAVRGESAPYSEEELLYGRILLSEAHPVLKQFLEREITINRKIAEELEKISGVDNSVRTQERMRQIQHKIKEMCVILEKYF